MEGPFSVPMPISSCLQFDLQFDQWSILYSKEAEVIDQSNWRDHFHQWSIKEAEAIEQCRCLRRLFNLCLVGEIEEIVLFDWKFGGLLATKVAKLAHRIYHEVPDFYTTTVNPLRVAVHGLHRDLHNILLGFSLDLDWISAIKLNSKKVSRIKRGLPGLVNGSRVSALADTGAAHNVVSAAFVQNKALTTHREPSWFKLGNSKHVHSVGTVSLRWAFADEPEQAYDVVCHVLPNCDYDLILGSKFLKATETLSKHPKRFAKCVFSVFNLSHINILGNHHQGLDGKVAGYQTLAVPDTGAERNVMDLCYAEELGFKIKAQSEYRTELRFANGSSQISVGQVDTTWTFTSGLKVPVTFEVLENCCADVILGEDILFEHNVFQTYAASIQPMSAEKDDELFDLAPFSYLSDWQQEASAYLDKGLSNFKKITPCQNSSDRKILDAFVDKERRRRHKWNRRHGDEGTKASPAEKLAEDRRREEYKARLDSFKRRPHRPEEINHGDLDDGLGNLASTHRRRTAPLTPSIPTSPSDAPIHLATMRPKKTAPVNYGTPSSINDADTCLIRTGPRIPGPTINRTRTMANPPSNAPTLPTITE